MALCEVGQGKVCELAKLTSRIPIENVEWSQDGKLVAFTDRAGTLAVKRVANSCGNQENWHSHDEFNLVIPPDDGNIIYQLIFYPTGYKLFLATPLKIYIVDLESQTLTKWAALEASSSTYTTPTLKWACHPMDPDTLLAFDNTKVQIWNWSDLRKTTEHIYFPPRVVEPSSDPTASVPAATTESLGRLLTTIGQPEILLQIVTSDFEVSSSHTKIHYLLFDVRSLQSAGDSNTDLPYTILPPNMTIRIREPLGILPGRRLVFVDGTPSICTWRLPAPLPIGEPSNPGLGGSEVVPEKVGEDDGLGVKMHYPLPKDWLARHDDNCLRAVMADGTLLSPWNGDVVTVQAARLRG